MEIKGEFTLKDGRQYVLESDEFAADYPISGAMVKTFAAAAEYSIEGAFELIGALATAVMHLEVDVQNAKEAAERADSGARDE